MTTLVLDATETAETAETPVLDFVAPIPGFPNERRFVLVSLDEAGLLYALRSADRPELRFLVAPPAPFFPEYSVEVDVDTLQDLGALDADELLVLLVINPGEQPGDTTANLMAPIVVSHRNHRAVQLVLGRSGLPVRAPLFIG